MTPRTASHAPRTPGLCGLQAAARPAERSEARLAEPVAELHALLPSALAVVRVARIVASSSTVPAENTGPGVMPAGSPTTFEDAEYENETENVFLFRAMMISMFVALITTVVKIQSFAASAARAWRLRKAVPSEQSAPGVRRALAAGRAAYETR